MRLKSRPLEDMGISGHLKAVSNYSTKAKPLTRTHNGNASPDYVTGLLIFGFKVSHLFLIAVFKDLGTL